MSGPASAGRNRRLRPSADPEAPDTSGGAPAASPAAPTPTPGRRLRVPARLVAAARFVAGTSLVVGVAWVVAWAARHYVMTSPRFAVTEIVVHGTKHRSPEEIAQRANVARGKNVFVTDLDEARTRLLEDPWLEEATAGRRLPGTILLDVKEREAAALVALGETFVASSDGELFKRLEPGDPTDLVVITGLTPESLAEDREGAVRAVRRALDLAADYERTPLAQKAGLQEIHLARDGSTTLVVGKNGISVALGSPPFRRKLEQASRVYAELEKRGGKADAILVDNDARPERVVVRVR